MIPDFENVYRFSPGLIVVLDPDFRIVFVNEAYLKAARFTREEMLGVSLFELFPSNPGDPDSDGHAILRTSLERVLRTGRADRMVDQRYDIRSPTSGTGEFIERYWTSWNYPILDSQGRVAHLVHQAEEVTEVVLLRRELAAREAKLNELMRVYQAVYDQGLYAGLLDLEGRVLDANRASLESCGFRLEDVIGKPFWECGWWTGSNSVQASVKAACQRALKGEATRSETPYFHADGSEHIVEFSCIPIKDEAGIVQFIVPTGLDVTDRVTTERDRRATSILESITDAFFAVDRDWRFTYVNRQAYRVLNRSPGELLNQVIWEVFPGLSGSDFEKAYLKAADEGISSSFTGYYPDHDRWYDVRVYPSSDGISIYFRDVSEGMQAEKELSRLSLESEKQRTMYEAALSNTPDLVYVFDPDHRFVYANESLLEMWGRTRAEALGKNCLELGYEPWHAEMHDREIDQVIATRRSIRGEVPFTGTHGRRIYEYIFSPVFDSESNVVAVAGTTRDVTDRQKAEIAIREQAALLRENDRRKDEFLAMLAHELRNPLSAVANAVTVLRMSHDEENAIFAREVIDRQVRQLTRLIDDLLDVSRITSGKIRLRRAAIDLVPILRQAIESVRPLMVERRHLLEIDFDETVLPVLADPTRIEQVLVNLLNNAAKYTEIGGRIRLAARVSGDQVVIEVEDNGIGIPPEKLPEMFRLFAQGERSIDRSEGGLGIGLTLVKKLTEMHGGSVSAASAGLGQGSKFTLQFPLAKKAVASRSETTPSEGTKRQGSRILVVDDNQDTAKGLARLLKMLGNQVELAHDGPAALESARIHRPDFVLLDIGLPGMDGYEVVQVLRGETDFDGTVIAISGYGQEKDRHRSREAGFDHHLVKPVDFDSLLSLLANTPAR